VGHADINLFGVYVAQIVAWMILAWMLCSALRRIATRWGLLQHVWHAALFNLAIYVIVLSSLVLTVAP
jgi:hypothetical protein